MLSRKVTNLKLFKFFHTPKFTEQDQLRAENCLNSIVFAVSEKSGIPEFIRYDNETVAFAGSRENMELVLEVFIQRYDGKNWLYASLDDEVSWQEWDYVNLEEFTQNIIDHLVTRVNRTIKTVTEKTKHKSYRQSSYYLDDTSGEWLLFEDECTTNALICLIAANRTETIETIKTYQLDLR